LLQHAGRLYISPASVLELQILLEAGRVRLSHASLMDIVNDDRWTLDDPPATAWFLEAVNLSWTRDPVDRLLAAHARLRRWRLATADPQILEYLGPAGSLEI
jgi:PIN domain nuclease of toxin-antitoxin system